MEKQAAEAFLAEFENLNLSDGVNLNEAKVIVSAIYYSELGNGCGAPGKIKEESHSWLVPTYSGFSAKPDAPIYINKSTGKVSRNGRVLIENPKNIELTVIN